METGESAPPSLGPRYAPDDPTLPKPWKGLVDGSTGLLYYWNPETNITQYEKPASLPPPLPLGPYPTASTSNPASIPVPEAHSVQNGVVTHHGQQNHHVPQHEGQSNTQLPQQHGHLMSQQHHPSMQMAPDGRPHSSQSSQVMQQQGLFAMSSQQLGQQVMNQGQNMAHVNHQMSQPPHQQVLQNSGQQILQPSIQHIGQQNIQNQTPLVGQPQGQQNAHQQLQYMGYQQNIHPTVPQNSQHQVQQSSLGQPFANHQEQKSTFQKRDEDNVHSGNQVGFSSSQFQQSGVSSVHNLHAGTNSTQIQQFGVPSDQVRQFGDPPGNMQQHHSVVQLQHAGSELPHRQHLSRFQNQMSPAAMQGQQAAAENLPGRGGNEYYFGRNNDGPSVGPHHPKLAAIPMARSQQDTRISGVPFQSVTPGHTSGMNFVAGQHSHNMYSHGSGGPSLANNAPIHPPLGVSDVSNMSPVEVYRQQHEVTATGDNVPAPFMTFEATGFPPEILREVRYLLRRRSICRTLHCYCYTCTCNNPLIFGGCKMDGWSLSRASFSRVLAL